MSAAITVLFATALHATEPKHAAASPPSAVYKVEHSLTVKDIPDGAKTVRIWFWFPDDDPDQKVLNYAVTQAPSVYRLTRDPVNGHRYLYAEADNPKTTLTLATEFTLRRTAAHIVLEPAKAGPITEAHRRLFAEYLRTDCPCMLVDDRITELANKICGNEKNVAAQARKLFDWVVANTDHYSKSKDAPKSSGQGSALYCLNQKGGGCTDQHALFIAMARARGIPTRLQFGSRLNPTNEGKDHDPGYRCWVQYFVPNYGWVSTDMSAADTNPGQEDFYFSGLDERRVWFLEGRDLELNPKQSGERINLLIVAHVEVDGRPHTAFTRNVRFMRVSPTE
jgi:transglutaminase-like putative cysteine protease